MVFGATSGQWLNGTVSHGLKRAHCSLWDATSANLDGRLDPSELVHVAMHVALEEGVV